MALFVRIELRAEVLVFFRLIAEERGLFDDLKVEVSLVMMEPKNEVGFVKSKGFEV